MSDAKSPPAQTQAFLDAIGAGEITPLDGTTCWFLWADTFGVAAFDGGEAQFQIVISEDADPDELREWLAAQPSMVRDWLDIEECEGVAELIFRGVVDADMELAQVHRVGEVLVHIGEQWARRASLTESHRTEQVHRPPTNPMDLTVMNAWLVFGSEASTPTPEGLDAQRAEAALGDYTWTWTVNKATRAGDLLLFYFTAPSKSLKYVARAASDAFFERASTFDHHARNFGPAQWWAYVTPLTRVPNVGTPIVMDLLEQPVMRGASGKYCKPEGITRLRQWMEHHHPETDVSLCLPRPIGNPHLPGPETMSLAQWRLMADGALYPEKVVESHMVEPLIRFILHGLGPGYELHGQYKLGRHRPDHVLFKQGHPQCVIETKVAVRRPRSSVAWSDSPDFQQAAGYARRLGARAALIDARAIYLLSQDLTDVDHIIDRRDVDEDVLAQLREFVGSS